MRKARRGAILALVSVMVLACGGCWVVSIHPLHTPETSVFEAKFHGAWVMRPEPGDEEQDVFLTVKRAENNTYMVTFEAKSKPQETVAFEGHLVRLGEHYYLDLAPDDNNPFLRGIPEMADPFVMTVHAFFRVELQDDKLTLIDMVSKDGGPAGTLRNLSTKYGATWVLFASTSQLQEAFRREGDTIFATGGRMAWRRKPVEKQ